MKTLLPRPIHPNLLAAALLLGSILPATATAADQTASWNNSTGNWSDATKWSTNPTFPNNGVNTFDAIQNAGTLTVDQAITIQKFNMTGGNNTGAGFALTLNDLLTWSGGTIGGSGAINANGGATINGGDKNLGGSRVLNLEGTSTWSAANISFLDTAQLVNKTGGVLTTSFDGVLGNFTGGSFTNQGTFAKSSGTGTTNIGVVFTNSGTVNANSGIVSMTNNGTHTGTLSAGAGGTVRFAGGTHNLNAGTSFSGAGTVHLTGGTLLLNTAVTSAASTTFSVAGGTVGGAGSLTVDGAMNWSGGTIGGSGAINANGGASINGGDKNLGGSRVLNLGGTSTWSAGNISFLDTTLLVNTAGGVLTTSFDGVFGNFTGGSFTNQGTFTKSGGAGTTNIGVSFSNTGTVNANSGTLSLTNTVVTQHSGTTLNGGTWNVSNGASINRTTGSNITTIGGASSVTLDGAGSSFAKVTNELNNNQGSFTLKNNRDLTTAGAYTNSGTTRVEDSTTVMTIGTGGSAAYTQTGGVTALVNGAFIDASVFNLNGGTLQGTGTIESSVIAGPGSSTIAPGMSPGTLTINGNLTLNSGSTLAMELGGLTQGSLYDYLDVNGVLTLAGMLDLDFINDFQNGLTSGEILTLATANSAILGSFSNVSSGSYLMTNYPIGLQVWYGAGSPFGAENLVVAIPEPSRALLLLAGLQTLWLRRRRPAFAKA